MTTRVWHETPQPWRLSEYRDYRPISSYALIGDLHTAALVGLNGSIDWCCLPHFDSASVFAGILDATRGGSFVIAPAVAHTSEQRYSPATNVLITTFSLDAGGVVELTDFMPITTSGHRGDFAGDSPPRSMHARRSGDHRAIRAALRLRRTNDSPSAAMERCASDGCARRRAYAWLDRATSGGDSTAAWRSPRSSCGKASRRGSLPVTTTTRYVRSISISRKRSSRTRSRSGIRGRRASNTLGRYRAVVERSALALKLMCFQPTGRDCRGANDIVAGTDRRRAQLGLSIHVAA